MSNTLDKIVTKTRKKAPASPAPSLDALPEASLEGASLEASLLEASPASSLKGAPSFEEATQNRSACSTLGVSKEGVIVVGPGGFKKVFSTVEEASAWLKV